MSYIQVNIGIHIFKALIFAFWRINLTKSTQLVDDYPIFEVKMNVLSSTPQCL